MTICYIGLAQYWLKTRCHHLSSLVVFPQIGKLTGFSWLVFLSLGEFLVNKYNRVFICGRCYLVSSFCSSCFKEKYHPFALTNLKKKDEKIFSAQIIAKSTWRSKLLNSQTAGEPRIGMSLSLLTSEAHVCVIRVDCVALILNSPGVTQGVSFLD